MKKFLAIIFTVFYFGSSSGMVYNLHYCLDKVFVSTAASSKTCDLCGTTDKKDCCKSEVKVMKTDIAQKADISFINLAPSAAVLHEVFYANFLPFPATEKHFVAPINAPPDRAILPLFISHCNFRI